MATASTEERELQLVERVEFKILGVCNKEDELAQTLTTYLAPLLLKAGSPHVAVRNQVIRICQRLQTFIQSPSIVLPVEALIDQYKRDDLDSALIKHLDAIFIQHSIDRLNIQDRIRLLPKILRGISTDRSSSASSIFNVFLRILSQLPLPPRRSKEDYAFREALGLDDPKDAAFIAEWLGKLFLLRPSSATNVSPGLTQEEVLFLTLGKPETWSPEKKGLSFPPIRAKAASFLASGAFTDSERFVPSIYLSGSSDYRTDRIADDILKRTSVDLESEELIKALFEMYFRPGIPTACQVTILGILTKSAKSVAFSKEIVQAVKLSDFSRPIPEDAHEMPTDSRPKDSLERQKLCKALFEYLNWIARIGPSVLGFNKLGSELVELLRSFIVARGWPVPSSQGSSLDALVRLKSYEGIGTIAKGASLPSTQALAVVQFLFKSLAEDRSDDIVVTLNDALAGLTVMFPQPMSPDVVDRLRGLLLSEMTRTVKEDPDGRAAPLKLGSPYSAIRSTRLAATKWANRCFPFTDVYARWIDILAIAGRPDERSDVIEEGYRGLDPWTYRASDNDTRTLPDWERMATTLFKEPISSVPGSADPATWTGIDVGRIFVNFPGETVLAFPIAVNYCKRILFLSAVQDFQLEPGWEQRLQTLVVTDKKTRQMVRHYLLDNFSHHQALSLLLSAAFEGAIHEVPSIVEECARAFVEIAAFTPRLLLSSVTAQFQQLLPLIRSNKKEIRYLGARACGILAALPTIPASRFSKLRDDLIAVVKNLGTAVGSDLNSAEGALLALAHLVSRRVFYTAGNPAEIAGDLAQHMLTVDSVASASTSIQETLFDAYSQLWVAGVRTMPGNADSQGGHKEILTKAFVDPLCMQARKGREKAITALGRFAIAFPGSEPDGSDMLDLVLAKLYELYEMKQAEVQFAVGEAICTAVACWDAEVVQVTQDVQPAAELTLTAKRSEKLTSVVDKVLGDCKQTKPSLLRASGIWLFCLVQHCSHLDEVQSRLRECQAAFMRLLSARDELIQETASRGLALVYERGDSTLKGALVSDLVSAFTGSGPQLKVDDDTELFEAGALPTGEGKSITSYKDIVSLAREVGDQSLVYKFMSLATNAAAWSTRSAFGRFGLSSILSESEVDPKLYPKLYRYRFDPNPNVQKSMDDIWKALVKDSNSVLETHFDAIMQDLLKSIRGKEWRMRQASCAAISDLISGRPFQRYEAHYSDIWAEAARALDDIKATVRTAALGLCIALSNTLVRQLEEASSSSTSAAAMMEKALPFLLSDRGIENSVEDVKIFATLTVIKIAKTGGKLLKPFIPAVVTQLLGLLSTIEPDAINYHYLRAGEDNRDKIDKLRSAMVSKSPISEAIEDCLRNVDKEVMESLTPGLEGMIKSAIGMPTKIGCGRILVTLATRHGNDFRPYAARFLSVMEKQTLDRNDEVSQSYARATAYIIRVASSESNLQFVEHCINLYLNSEDETRREKIADLVLALSKLSPEHFTALENHLLPFSYLAQHDTDEYAQKEFREVWDKHSGSNLTVTRYIPEIVDLVQRALGTAQWALKHAGALTIASAVVSTTSASDVSGLVSTDNLRAVWPVLERALALKTFAGKEKLLEAFTAFVAKSPALWEADTQFGAFLHKIAVREARRNNDEYRPHAFRCLWKFAAARRDLDMLPEIADIVMPFVLELGEDDDGDAMDIDEAPPSSQRIRRGGLDLKTESAWAAVEAVAKGYSRTKMVDEPLEVLARIACALEKNIPPQSSPAGPKLLANPYLAQPQFDILRRTFWYECLGELVEQTITSLKASTTSQATNTAPSAKRSDSWSVLNWFLRTLDLDSVGMGTEVQRLWRAKAARALLGLRQGMLDIPSLRELGGTEKATITFDILRKATTKAEGEERSEDVRREWARVRDILNEPVT